VLAEVKDLELRAGPSTRPTPPSSCCCAAISASPSTTSTVESWRVITDAREGGEATSEATVKLTAGGERYVATGEGNGPVNALDHALRLALARVYPELEHLELVDFRVRILDASHGTDAITRVLIETADGTTTWQTVGVAANIVEASWMALVDGITYGLHREGVPAR
jgi:2-isopropylmalate synthase